MEKLAILKNENEVIGFVTCRNNYQTLDAVVDLIPEDLPVIDLAEGKKFVPDKNKSALENVATMPIGTPLKITGCVEGMNGQQLVYVGSSPDEYGLGLLYYWFFDGCCSAGEYPACFGYERRQLEYEGVKVVFDENDNDKVDELLSNYSYQLDVASKY